MIPIPSGARVWIATGKTDMRKGMLSLAMQIQQPAASRSGMKPADVPLSNRAELFK